jgi:uncharacterized membrane protein YdfJ with MMPL/SSD domain
MLKWVIKRPVAIVVAVVAVFFLWLAFRPELLFVNKSVDEPFPTSASSSVTNSMAPRH